MFPLSHTYVSTKVTGRKSDLLIFGSVLPDIATTSKNELGRDEIHYSPMKFFSFIKSNHIDLLDLAIGVRLHSNVNKGADFYSDDSKIGYAKIEGRKINSDVTKLLGIEENEVNLISAHNFIEAAVDLNLLESHPYLLSIYQQSIKNCDLHTITKCLSEYLQKDRKIVRAELKNFISFLSPEHLSSPEAIVDGIAVPLIELKFEKKVNSKQSFVITNKAVALTKATYLNFLNDTVRKIRIDFADLVSS